MAYILIFLFIHWYVSAFCQSFFQHRYMAHRMFTMSPRWERFFYILTWLSQGSSFLHPRAYALLHLEHHTHSDTDKDPHSPHFFKDIASMMINTAKVYQAIARGKREGPKNTSIAYPDWPAFDKIATSPLCRLIFCLAYIAFYIAFAPSLWWFLLLPIHFLMGPVHGAFINWCGHKYGYRNYDNKDHSKNTFFWDLFFMGECFQNNHHRFPQSANFAKRWFEFDLLYPAICVLHFMKVIHITQKPSAHR